MKKELNALKQEWSNLQSKQNEKTINNYTFHNFVL